MQREIGQLRTWYDLAVTRRGRTTVGVSRLTPEEMGTFIGAFLDGQAPPNPRADIPLAALFRYAVEDLKAYYCEAFAVQPGYSTVDSTTLADWFWRATTAGRVLFAVHEVVSRAQSLACTWWRPASHSQSTQRRVTVCQGLNGWK